jgi:hypothetical protein
MEGHGAQAKVESWKNHLAAEAAIGIGLLVCLARPFGEKREPIVRVLRWRLEQTGGLRLENEMHIIAAPEVQSLATARGTTIRPSLELWSAGASVLVPIAAEVRQHM